MFEGMAVIVLTVLVVLVVAVGVIVALAVTRRPADQWRSHLLNQPASWTELEDEGVVLDDVDPQEVSLEDMLATRSQTGSGYVEPEEIPGYEHLENAAERIEGLQAQRSSGATDKRPGAASPAAADR
ncbi:MAG: hypothetical protein ACTJGR_02665 [Pauljensenia sp.]